MALVRSKGDYAVAHILLTMIQIAAEYSEGCTKFYTIFEEKSCSGSDSTQMIPALINTTTWNISRYDMNLDEYCYDMINEDCFLELSCEDHETVCEEVLVTTTETVTTDTLYTSEPTTSDHNAEDYTFSTEDVDNVTEMIMYPQTADTIIIEEREFFTLFTETTCDGANSTVIKSAPINYETWNISRYDLYGDGDCFDAYPALDSFLELSCSTTTTCSATSATDELKSEGLHSAVQYSLITLGAVASTILLSYISYCAYDKVVDILQSGVYRLPQ